MSNFNFLCVWGGKIFSFWRKAKKILYISPTMETTKLRIGIIGGGPAGLLVALALKRKGFSNVSVFDRDQGSTLLANTLLS
jgi:NADPH-dependent glutamate synthase beta subunit-like oxidoreductase